MLGELTITAMEELLNNQVIGHLGCHADGETYVVPINYVYRGLTVYAHSKTGKKIDMMRKNSRVCLLVDQIKDTFTWKSVILTGKFEEITDESEKHQAMQGIIHKLMPLTNTPHQGPSHAIAPDINGKIEAIVYKILIDTMTGRFERSVTF
ncbi:nitroimidazol reductase NimA-like FMN-containing flavoprotein (pyridoxamine 5'-phosphate oxidase superfamily) [Pedobacter sp. UYP24]